MLFSGWFVTVLALTRLYVIVGSWWCLVWLQPWLHTTALWPVLHRLSQTGLMGAK
jgi:hypothetical protein